MEELEVQPHMVEQVIRYSDETETVISYRGRIVDGVLIPDEPEETKEVAKPKRLSKLLKKLRN